MNLLGKGSDPKFWCETVRESECYRPYVEARLREWQTYCEGQTITELKYSDFKRFFVDGNRTIYESQYFKRRHMLCASSVLALIYPEEQKYIDFLQDVIFAICNEYTWCVPAHHPKLDENNNSFIDLFAAETGFALAEIYTMLGDRLDRLITERIKAEINIRIVESFMSDTYFWWEHRCTNNWTAVCGGSVACTLMLMRPELIEELKPRIDVIMEHYLSGIYDDGYCLEGTGYWHYGFGFFAIYADMLKRFTDGADDYFKLTKVRAIATFIQKMFLSESASVSFADGGTSLTYHIGLVHYLKQLYPDDVKVYSPNFSYDKDGCGRYCMLIRAATWLDPEIYAHPEDNCSAEYYGEDSKWYVKRTDNYGFAAKSGFNDEHHNHNDVGTFIFAKDGKQLITDMGKGLYCKQYFRANTRYDFIECSSLGHSVPYFGDIIQKTGKEFSASDTVCRTGYFAADIAGAYGDERVKRILREFCLTDTELTMTDTFDYSGDAPITERFVSLIEPKAEGGKVIIGTAQLSYNDSCTPKISSMENSNKKTVWFIDFTLPHSSKSFCIKLK